MPQKKAISPYQGYGLHANLFGGIVAHKWNFSTYPHFAQIIHSFERVIHRGMGNFENWPKLIVLVVDNRIHTMIYCTYS